MTPWELWALGVLDGIGAPVNAINLDTLWAWSNAETAPYYLMRWNNPLNTTQPWPGAVNSGAQPGPHDVKIYATLQDGINATIATLLNGYYPNIVANLRSSIPRQQWGANSSAGAQLHLWGTGTNWLQATYGAAPGNLGVDDMTPEQDSLLRKAVGAINQINNAILLRPDGTAEFPGDTPAHNSQLFENKVRRIVSEELAKVAIGGGGVEPPEPAEPKVVTLNVPAQTIQGTLS